VKPVFHAVVFFRSLRRLFLLSVPYVDSPGGVPEKDRDEYSGFGPRIRPFS